MSMFAAKFMSSEDRTEQFFDYTAGWKRKLESDYWDEPDLAYSLFYSALNWKASCAAIGMSNMLLCEDAIRMAYKLNQHYIGLETGGDGLPVVKYLDPLTPMDQAPQYWVYLGRTHPNPPQPVEF